MAYDGGRGFVVLFGGHDANNSLNDTWEWDGTDWMQRFPITSPPARTEHSMAYDNVRGRTVIFGGFDGGLWDDTWEWDGASWSENTSTTRPPARWKHAMAFDAVRQSIVLFGNNYVSPSDTWEYVRVRLTASPVTRTIKPGEVTSFTVTTEGLPVSFTLVTSPLPPDVLAQFYPSSIITPPAESTLILTTSSSTPDGIYPIALTQHRDGLTLTVPLTLTVITQDFWLTPVPSYWTLYPGTVVTHQVALTGSATYAGPVTMTLTGLPTDVEATLSPNPALPDTEVDVTLSTTASAVTGTYDLLIVGTGAVISDSALIPITRTAPVTLSILPRSIIPVASPNSRTVYQSQTTAYSITIQATPGITQPAELTIEGLDGIDFDLFPNPIPLDGAATLAVTATLSTAPGTYDFTVIASSGNQTGTAQAKLTVLPAALNPLASPSSQTIYQAQSAVYTVSVEATPGLTQPVILAVDGLDDATGTMWPNPLPLGEIATLAVMTSLDTAPGSRVFTVTASSVGLAGIDYATLNVLPADITPSVSPLSRSVHRGQKTSYTVDLAATSGFTLPATLAAGGLPDGTPYSFVPAAISPGQSSTLLITTTGRTPPGEHQFSITATVGSIVRSVDAMLEVNVAIYMPLVVRRWPPIPYQPYLYAIDNADGDSNYTLSWTEQPERLANTYTLQEATNSAFTIGLRMICTTAQQSCTVMDNPPGTYYYRVRGQNPWGYSGWSNTRWTIVLPPPPIQNGDFEQGPGVGWQEYSSHGWPLIVSSDVLPVPPRSGDWAAWLGGDYDELSVISQQVTIPTGNPNLTFWYWIASQDICGYDFGGVMIDLDSVVDAFHLCYDENTGGWVQRTVNLSAYAGQTVELDIVATTDGSLNSNLWVDDVALGGTALSDSPATEVFQEGDWTEDKEAVLPTPP